MRAYIAYTCGEEEKVMSDLPKIVLDIRTEEEFLEGHMPDAVNCGIQDLNFVLDDVEHEDKILLVCLTGKRASQVKLLLEEEGFSNVEVLAGGMKAYKGEIVQGE
jgi:phage shock protein E